ncbi:chemokine-like receptor 1 [Pygocentrus nattereri]|uniref:chemokine-like receptor 1 n=1 Tax=Pygocentrus nattereri TaxID=42514 RepID=UPI000814221B|nr:chemokine-like receptor 1 [Pygocentrus nattereri]XP_017572195.1 chemokine-like receptor 1 [Pygocentrus nattereri]XP_017572196.1 chemokine-like receptor 1 [Pygocentrus nattereri]XP_017572197.1 chemokine-like receptor 1 [Pygocentrus nattereri]XP_017572199.1 chemokine-like receptor 1 [Pygocentrus nattereri]XP_017572200.1 chemokine-like receptor 1 [Pygocentrus nattereri]XP_017572201.1 chemokine-like receptor 1 [Pygocentrus nattereri]XP_037387869.1 chemokine-like receptor 1 [Pygocentrus natter
MDNNMSDYNYDEIVASSQSPEVQTVFLNYIRMQYLIVYLIVCTLGVTLNSYVIIAGCHVYQKVQNSTPSMWILALAVTHLVFSAFLVLQFLYVWYHFNWHYGAALCKISSYIIYGSMFSTAALLSLWSISSSISSCAEGLCARCSRHGTTLVLLLSSWTFGAVLSSPSLLSRELRYTNLGEECIDDYDLDKQNTTPDGMKNFTAVVLSRFLLGILVPVFMMTISACLARRQSHDQDGSLKRVTCAIKVAYFICWTPLLVLGLLQVTEKNHESFTYGLPAATVLAAAHSVINPVIYLFLGRKMNMRWMAPGYTDQEYNSGQGVALNTTRPDWCT